MRVARIVFFYPLIFLTSVQLNSQQTTTTVQRDSQAVSLVQQSAAAMATAPPSDSTATGTVSIIEGSKSQNGSIQILTLGTTRTSETLNLPDGKRATIYANGDAKETNGSESTNPPLETIVTDQCPDFPLPLLLSALANSDEAFRYVGGEFINGTAVQHIQFWNNFSSKPRLQKLAPFSIRDIWLDSASGLPVRIAYLRRAGGGSFPAIPVEVNFSNYTRVSGVLYPFQISKSLNGTLWQTITIQNVAFGVGLTDVQFQTE